MGTSENSFSRCRLCFHSISEGEETIQITDMMGKSRTEFPTVNKIQSILHLKLDFPDDLKNCVIAFPHFVCVECDKMLDTFMQFIERAQTVDHELRHYDFSKNKSLNEIEISLKEKYFLLSCNTQLNVQIHSSATFASLRAPNDDSKNIQGDHNNDTYQQSSMSMMLDGTNTLKLARKRPITILPKTSANHAHFEKPTTLFGNGMAVSSDGVSDLICETKTKNFECNIHPCKRSFETITALRHHIKHFHKSCSKQDKPADRDAKSQGIGHSFGDSKYLALGVNLAKSSITTDPGITSKVIKYVSTLPVNSNLISSGVSTPFQLSSDSSIPTTRCNANKLVVNLQKPFSCPHGGCMKAYKNKHYLIDHERVHKGEKPFLCKNCDRSFYRVTDLKKHRLLKVCQ